MRTIFLTELRLEILINPHLFATIAWNESKSIYHSSLEKEVLLRLTESVNCFFSFLKIKFTAENVNLLKRMLQFKHIDSRASAVR